MFRATAGPGAAPTRASGQVLMNLAVNARDAMPRGGRLIVETANVDLDGRYVAGHRGVAPGPYVMITVTDTGVGMTRTRGQQSSSRSSRPRARARAPGSAWPPCSGSWSRAAATVWVYSEVDRGTTFKIYLPRRGGRPAEARPAPVVRPGRRGTETVLLVEDDAQVRELVHGPCSTAHGYRVLEARQRQRSAADVRAARRSPIRSISCSPTS